MRCLRRRRRQGLFGADRCRRLRKDDGKVKIARTSRFDPDFHEDLQDAVVAIHDILRKADLDSSELKDFLNSVTIIPSDRMISCAGRAALRQNSLTLNRRLFKIHRDHLQQTVVHEVCHLLNYKINNLSGHGRSWQALMVRCGFKPVSCHDMDVSALRR